MDMNDVQRAWDSFAPEGPWRREGGARLMLTPSGYGMREDGEGRLYPLNDSDIVIGRDDRRARRLVQGGITEALERAVEVPRDAVVGKGKAIHGKRAKKRDCRCDLLDDGRIAKPSMFVTYLTPKGNRIRFQVKASD